MTITVEMLEESTSEYIASDGKPVIEISETYLMQDNSSSRVYVNAARLNFHSATGIVPGAAHASTPAMRYRKVDPKRLPTRQPWQQWTVTCSATTDCPLIDDPNPANRRWKRSVTDSDQQRFIFRDRNDKLIVDKAGTPFDGGVPINVKLITYKWQHNTDWSVYNLGTIGDISGTINSDSFLGKDPYTLMLTYAATEEWEGEYHYASEEFTIIYDPMGWKPKPANAGLYELYSSSIYSNATKRRPIKIDGKYAIEPEPLTTSGAVIPYSQRPDACNFITVDYYNEIAFGDLGLPTT
jgi:hypothetical protein